MIWATVNSQSCFCWLNRTSPSLATKTIINLISVFTIWWCPCVESFLRMLEECLLWPVSSLGKTRLAFALPHSVLQGRICLLLQVSLYLLLLQSTSLQWKRHLFGVLVLEILLYFPLKILGSNYVVLSFLCGKGFNYRFRSLEDTGQFSLFISS